MLEQSEAVEKEVRIAARPETIFPYFTDPDKMVQWKGFSATLDPRPGGMYRVEISDQNIARGEYVEIVPYSKVVFSWGWEGDGAPVPPGSSTVEVTLTADGDDTVCSAPPLRAARRGAGASRRGLGPLHVSAGDGRHGHRPWPRPVAV